MAEAAAEVVGRACRAEPYLEAEEEAAAANLTRKSFRGSRAMGASAKRKAAEVAAVEAYSTVAQS